MKNKKSAEAMLRRTPEDILFHGMVGFLIGIISTGVAILIGHEVGKKL